MTFAIELSAYQAENITDLVSHFGETLYSVTTTASPDFYVVKLNVKGNTRELVTRRVKVERDGQVLNTDGIEL